MILILSILSTFYKFKKNKPNRKLTSIEGWKF